MWQPSDGEVHLGGVGKILKYMRVSNGEGEAHYMGIESTELSFIGRGLPSCSPRYGNPNFVDRALNQSPKDFTKSFIRYIKGVLGLAGHMQSIQSCNTEF